MKKIIFIISLFFLFSVIILNSNFQKPQPLPPVEITYDDAIQSIKSENLKKIVYKLAVTS